MVKCKCKDCDKRYPGCHSKCEDYKKYREMLDEKRKKERLEKEVDDVLIRSHLRAVKKLNLASKKGYKSNNDWKGD